MPSYQFFENTIGGNRQRTVDWSDMRVLMSEKFNWSHTPSALYSWGDANNNKNGIRVTFRPDVNLYHRTSGLNAVVEVYEVDDNVDVLTRKRKYKLSEGFYFFCKLTRTFIRCDMLKPSYVADFGGGLVLSDVELKIDFYMLS